MAETVHPLLTLTPEDQALVEAANAWTAQLAEIRKIAYEAAHDATISFFRDRDARRAAGTACGSSWSAARWSRHPPTRSVPTMPSASGAPHPCSPPTSTVTL